MRRRRHLLRRVLNQALRPLQLRLVTYDQLDHLEAGRERLAGEAHDAYRRFQFPDLPDRAGRASLLAQLDGTQLPGAMHLLDRLHRSLASGEGDVVEMGVCQGYTSALLANELPEDRMLWLYDSFEGLSAPSSEDELIDDILHLGSMGAYAGRMAAPESHVRALLDHAGFPAERTRVVAGFIHADLPADLLPASVALAYLDFDLFEPILVGLHLLDPRTRAGSTIVVDDYGFFSSGPARAVAQFLDECPRYECWVAPPEDGHFCVLVRR